MKNDELFNFIGEIDDELIQKAESYVAQPTTKKRFSVNPLYQPLIALCIAGVVIIGAGLIVMNSPLYNGGDSPIDGYSTTSVSEIATSEAEISTDTSEPDNQEPTELTTVETAETEQPQYFSSDLLYENIELDSLYDIYSKALREYYEDAQYDIFTDLRDINGDGIEEMLAAKRVGGPSLLSHAFRLFWIYNGNLYKSDMPSNPYSTRHYFSSNNHLLSWGGDGGMRVVEVITFEENELKRHWFTSHAELGVYDYSDGDYDNHTDITKEEYENLPTKYGFDYEQYPDFYTSDKTLMLLNLTADPTKEVRADFKNQNITDEKLVQLVESGEIPQNVTHLNLSKNKINDLSSLRSLTNLTRLDLSLNEITDISELNQLTKLTHLNIQYNSISDISPLHGLKSLKYLNFIRYDFVDSDFALDALKAVLPDCIMNN